MTPALGVELRGVSKPTASSAIGLRVDAGVLRVTSGRLRDRVYAHQGYLDALAGA